MNIEAIPMIKSDDYNYKRVTRDISTIKYVIIHYTGNVGDTAANNCKFFQREKVERSAHYFVSDFDVPQSVPLDHAAFSVGDKSNPKKASMYGKINNFNSVSIECCGGKTSTEASLYTKKTAAELAASLCIYLNLSPSAVFRHYDVSGKICPAWAVNDTKEWFAFLNDVYSYHRKLTGGGKMYTQEEYNKFVEMMDKYKEDQAKRDANWSSNERDLCEKYGIMKDGRPYSWLTRKDAYYIVSRLLRLFGKT